MQRPWKSLALATKLFTAGFAIAIRFQLTHGVLYRLAANDWANAAGNFVLLAIQGLALWGALFLLGRKMLVTAMALAFVSIVVNLGYGQTVNDLVSTGTLSWMAAEARQAGNAAGEFLASLLFAGLQAILAIALIVGARLLFERGRWLKSGSIAGAAGVALVLAPSLLAVPFGLSASAAERNLYSLGYEVAMTEPPPPRDPVDLEPDTRDAPRHIVW